MKYIMIVMAAAAICISCLHAQQLHKYEFQITNMPNGVNSGKDDYSPVYDLANNILFFNSYRDEGSRGGADVYYILYKDGEWQTVENAGSSFNTKKDDGSITLARDGYTVLLASDGREGGFGSTDLYRARLSYTSLENVMNLGEKVNSSAWESQPSVTGDGKTVYFASDRSGGYGGTDIWMSTSDDWGNWSKPVNLGKSINTDGNEAAPNITPDGGTLYFSSDGFAGYGKMDIFVSTKINQVWDQPVNLGERINSPEDELYFYAPEDGNMFFFASRRDGGKGGLDVYSGTPNVFGRGWCTLAISVIDSATGSPLPSFVDIRDEATGEIMASISTNTQVQEYVQSLPAGRRYKVTAQFREYPPKTVIADAVAAGERQNTLIRFGNIQIADIDMSIYNIPFFVTGYYLPNVIENLNTLEEKLQGPLRKASYIENVFNDPSKRVMYERYAENVQRLFDDVIAKLKNDVFPGFLKTDNANEVLEITVTGYADPQPILGTFQESDTVRFVDTKGAPYVVTAGTKMTNLILSGLRAHYSAKHLTDLFYKRGEYAFDALIQQNRLQFKIIAAGVSENRGDLAAQRRIRITIARKGQKIDF